MYLVVIIIHFLQIIEVSKKSVCLLFLIATWKTYRKKMLYIYGDLGEKTGSLYFDQRGCWVFYITKKQVLVFCANTKQVSSFVSNLAWLCVIIECISKKKFPLTLLLLLLGCIDCGKSDLVKNIFDCVSKVFITKEETLLSLLAPTSVAVISINRKTVHSNISCWRKLVPLSHKNCA